MGDMTDASSPIHILLVEDSADDAALTLRALKRAKLQNHVWTVSDGLDALAFLRGDPPHQGAPRCSASARISGCIPCPWSC